MAEPTVVAVDPPPPTDDFDSVLPIPPLDPAFFSQQLIGNDGVLGANQEDTDLDFFLDLSFDDDNLCTMDDLFNPTQLHQFNTPAGDESNFSQFASDFSDFDPHAFFKSTASEIHHLSGDGNVSGNHSSNGSGVFSSASPGIESRQISGCLNVSSPESNHESTEKLVGESIMSHGSGNCGSKISNHNVAAKSVSTSPNSNSSLIIGGVVDQKIELGSKNNNVKSSLLKRKNEADDMIMKHNRGSRISKHRKSNCDAENNDDTHDNDGLGDGEDKRKARLIRNRENAQLSRHRKKQYVEELEEKVKAMNSIIQDLNAKISYFMAENVDLRQQVGGAGFPPSPMAPPPPGMYSHPAMMYPWMPYALPYIVKPQGFQVPLVPIPRLKPKQPAQVPKVNKKMDSKKNEGTKTKKVAGVSFLGLLFFVMLFGGLVPMVNVKYGGVREAFTGGKRYVEGGISEKHHGRVLMLNGTEYGGSRRECRGNSNVNCGRELNTNELVNGSHPLVASLYVPRNDKLVKIDGNLIIHSILASEKSLASHGKESGETSLAVLGDLSPAIPVAGVVRNGAKHSSLAATDGKLQQWFREGLSGPMLTSGMCTEVFQFDVSQAIVPATTTRNISEGQNQNTTHLNKQRNRRILYDLPIQLPESSHNFSGERNNQKEKLNGNNNASSLVVSVLVDPREAGDADVDGVMGTKSLSQIFVVVLIDSVKHVTYSCMLPFKASGTPHLVTT